MWYDYIAHARKMADRTYGFQRSSAGSLERSGFRETQKNILISVAHLVRDSISRTNRRSSSLVPRRERESLVLTARACVSLIQIFVGYDVYIYSRRRPT